MLRVQVLEEAGLHSALFGLSLSFNADPDRMEKVLTKLAPLDKGHNKALESVQVWLDITGPRYWWSQFDTYRVGTTKQSESTMHTLMKKPITEVMFTEDVAPEVVRFLEAIRQSGNHKMLKANLPEGFLQRRVVCTNYKVLRNMYQQRADHKLEEWQDLFGELVEQLEYPEWVVR